MGSGQDSGMEIRVGTSGYAYKEWRGSFYPEKQKPAEMLRYYAERFSAVEINNTFYKLPERGMLERWAEQVPPGFVFVLKASQRITHRQRLSLESKETLDYLFDVAGALGPRLGPVLFQTPPFLKKDAPRLRAFLDLLPSGRPVAFEFRHETWRDQEVYDTLRARNAALVCADTEESGETGAEIVPTADWGYLRLRRCDYDDADAPPVARPHPRPALAAGPLSSSSTRTASPSPGRRSSASCASGGSGGAQPPVRPVQRTCVAPAAPVVPSGLGFRERQSVVTVSAAPSDELASAACLKQVVAARGPSLSRPWQSRSPPASRTR